MSANKYASVKETCKSFKNDAYDTILILRQATVFSNVQNRVQFCSECVTLTLRQLGPGKPPTRNKKIKPNSERRVGAGPYS